MPTTLHARIVCADRPVSLPQTPPVATSAAAVPTTLHAPPACQTSTVQLAAAVDGCDVWLVHPWSLGRTSQRQLPFVAVFDLTFISAGVVRTTLAVGAVCGNHQLC